MATTSELRPCECGSRNIIEVRRGTRVWYECGKCNYIGPEVNFAESAKAEARRLWNERKGEQHERDE